MQTVEKRTTGWLVIETIRNYGVDTVFGIPGTHNLEFYRPLGQLGMRAVTARHEQGAGYGSDGWSLQTGKPGVVITTSGPGLLNALSSAGTAYCESRPMILLAPGPARGAEFADVGTLHETKDQLAAASAIVEWGRRVLSADEAVQAIHDAFELFATGRQRPVYVEIPLDLLEEESELDRNVTKPRDFVEPAAPDAALIADAARMLAEASHPVILAGGGSRRAGAELRDLAERLSAPVVSTLNGKGVLEERHPLALGSNLRLSAVRDFARNADVLLVVGSKLGDAELWVDALDAQGAVIRIDIQASQLQKNQTARVGIVADATAALTALIAALGPQDEASAARRNGAEDAVAQARARARLEAAELAPRDTAIAAAIARALPENAIVTTDSSRIGYCGLLNELVVSEPNSTPYMATYATLGYGLPAAIGSRIAAPERPVFVVTGDGALMFSVQECVTAVEQGLDVTVIVVDNGGYAEIEQNEADAGIAPVGVRLTQPNWPALAEAFGGTGCTVTNATALAQAVGEAVAHGGLQLIHLRQSDFDAETPARDEVHA